MHGETNSQRRVRKKRQVHRFRVERDEAIAERDELRAHLDYAAGMIVDLLNRIAELETENDLRAMVDRR